MSEPSMHESPTAVFEPGAAARPLQGRRSTAWLRGLGLALVTMSLFVAWALGYLPALAVGRRGAWRNELIHRWGQAAARVLGIRVRTTGTPPEAGTLLVANHLSYVDILVLASQVRCVFLSKAEVASWPVLGWMARAVGVLFIKREDRRSLPEVARTLDRELRAGHTVVLFPEGTSSRGAEVLPFRASLLAPAAEGGLPVAWAVLGYRIPPDAGAASERVCWWGEMTFAPHFARLLELPSIEAELRFGSELLRQRDRKALAQDLWEAVQAHFEPVR
jgi:1-acyl-sn-glycerol-3-phosphate acyltransferase